MKRRNRQLEAPVEYSKELAELIKNLASYVNENRLANVVSHIGEVHMPADLGKLIKEMSYDVVEDFLKEHSALYNVIDKSEIKVFNKELNKMISSLVKNLYMTVH